MITLSVCCSYRSGSRTWHWWRPCWAAAWTWTQSTTWVCLHREHVLGSNSPDELRADAAHVLWGQKGNTALHYVCQRKSQSLVPLLLEKNSDINIRNNVRTRSQQSLNASGRFSPPALLPSGWRDSIRHRNQTEVQQDSQHASEGTVRGARTDGKLDKFRLLYSHFIQHPRMEALHAAGHWRLDI